MHDRPAEPSAQADDTHGSEAGGLHLPRWWHPVSPLQPRTDATC